MKKVIIIVILLFMVLLISDYLNINPVINYINKNYYHNTSISGLVERKDILNDKNVIYFKILSSNKDAAKYVQIIVENENIWNLIEVNRTYFVTYESKNNKQPILYQIDYNDKFGQIYKDRLH